MRRRRCHRKVDQVIERMPGLGSAGPEHSGVTFARPLLVASGKADGEVARRTMTIVGLTVELHRRVGQSRAKRGQLAPPDRWRVGQRPDKLPDNG